MHICVSKLTIIGSDNGLSPGGRQAIIWTNAGMLVIGSLRTNLSEILIRIQTFSFKKLHLKMLSVKWHPFCLSFNVLTQCALGHIAIIWNVWFSNVILLLWISSPFPVKLSSCKCHRSLLMINQHWFGWWLSAVGQQAITWANVDPDLWCHMATQGHSKLTHCPREKWWIYCRADSRFVSSQWETALICNNVSHWLGTRLESDLYYFQIYFCHW